MEGLVVCLSTSQSTVWAEPEVIEAAAYEFGDTDLYLSTIEGLLGPYVWTRFDLLVLPPSFPYGGMENPCITYVGCPGGTCAASRLLFPISPAQLRDADAARR